MIHPKAVRAPHMKAYRVDGHHPLDHTNGVGDLRSCPVASRFEHGEGGLIPPSYKAMNEYVPVSTTDGEEDTEEKERGGEEGRVAAAASAVGGSGGDRKDLARRQLARLVFDDIDEDGDNHLETWELRDLLGEEREKGLLLTIGIGLTREEHTHPCVRGHPWF